MRNELLPIGDFIPGLLFEYIIQNTSDTTVNSGYFSASLISEEADVINSIYTIYVSTKDKHTTDHTNTFESLKSAIYKIYVGSDNQNQALFNVVLETSARADQFKFTGTLVSGKYSSIIGPVVVDFITGGSSDLDVKKSCRITTTANITLSGTQSIDGVSIVASNRVLVKNQSTAKENGIYICQSSTWTRATDFNSNSEVTSGAFTFIEEGGQADTGWVLTTDGTITVGTTALEFTQFSGAGTYSAGDGLHLSGTVFSISDTMNGTLTAGGFTTTGTWTFEDASSGTVAITTIHSGSSFTDNDTSLMTAGSIKKKIENYGYTTLNGTQTLTNKTLTSAVLNTGVSGSAILDSDTMSGASATTLSSSESIKAYVDAQTTDNIAEANNLYHTNVRARSAISVTDAGGDGSSTYNSTSGVITYTGPSPAEVRAHISVTDTGGSGSLTYSSSTGVITYTGPSTTEIITAVEAASNSNVFTDADHTKLNAIEASADVTDTTNVVAALTAGTNVTISAGGTIASTTYSVGDGGLTTNDFTNADHSKLNAIETSATADQTNAEIRTAVEAATDSNVFTDADHSKLNAIAAGADVTNASNVNAAGALMLSDTTTAGLGIVIDEDNMASNLATKVPTQQSVKAYVLSQSGGASVLNALTDCLIENNSIYLGNDPSSTTSSAQYNTSVGTALNAITTGDNNSALGYQALLLNTTGGQNCAFGVNALYRNRASNNHAFGYTALSNNTTGYNNIGIGYQALYENTTARDNIGIGYQTLRYNTTGNYNTAVGSVALRNNQTGYHNSAFGNQALYYNTTGYHNEAFGQYTLYKNTTGLHNIGIGRQTSYYNTTGSYNNAIGVYALLTNAGGSYNCAFGDQALYSATSSNNTAFGAYALRQTSSGGNNVSLGRYAGYYNYTGSNNVFIGSWSGKTSGSSNSDKLYIHSSAAGEGGLWNNGTSGPLIGGDFSSRKVCINGDLHVKGMRVAPQLMAMSILVHTFSSSSVSYLYNFFSSSSGHGHHNGPLKITEVGYYNIVLSYDWNHYSGSQYVRKAWRLCKITNQYPTFAGVAYNSTYTGYYFKPNIPSSVGGITESTVEQADYGGLYNATGTAWTAGYSKYGEHRAQGGTGNQYGYIPESSSFHCYISSSDIGASGCCAIWPRYFSTHGSSYPTKIRQLKLIATREADYPSGEFS